MAIQGKLDMGRFCERIRVEISNNKNPSAQELIEKKPSVHAYGNLKTKKPDF